MPSAKWMRKKLRQSIPMAQKQSFRCFEMWRTYFLQATDRDRWGETESSIKMYQM